MKTELLERYVDKKDPEFWLKKIKDIEQKKDSIVAYFDDSHIAKRMVDALMNDVLLLTSENNANTFITLNIFPSVFPSHDGVSLLLVFTHKEGDTLISETNALIDGFQFGYPGAAPDNLYDAITQNFDLFDEPSLKVIKSGNLQTSDQYLTIRLKVVEYD